MLDTRLNLKEKGDVEPRKPRWGRLDGGWHVSGDLRTPNPIITENHHVNCIGTNGFLLDWCYGECFGGWKSTLVDSAATDHSLILGCTLKTNCEWLGSSGVLTVDILDFKRRIGSNESLIAEQYLCLNLDLRPQYEGTTTTLGPLPQPRHYTMYVDHATSSQKLIFKVFHRCTAGDVEYNSMSWLIRSNRCFRDQRIQEAVGSL